MEAKEIQDLLFKDISDRMRQFDEELESEFHKVIKEFNLPLDKQAITDAGFLVVRNHSEKYGHSAVITRHGKPVSRTIVMDGQRINASCFSKTVKAELIKYGVFCDALDDVKNMFLESQLGFDDYINRKIHEYKCTEIEAGPQDGAITRMVINGKEYK